MSILGLLAVVTMLAACGAASAMPSLGGPTGIVTVPNALVAPQGQLQTALTYQNWSMYDGDATLWGLNVLGGVTDKAELWGAYASVNPDEDLDMDNITEWGFGGKYQFIAEPAGTASLAVGASLEQWDIEDDNLNVTKAYLVASKDLTAMTGGEWADSPTKMLGSIGLIYVNLDSDFMDESLTRPFAALQFMGQGGTGLGLEYRWKDDNLDDKAVFSAVLCHQFSPELSAQVGTTNSVFNGLGGDDQDIFVRLGYTFGLK